MVPHDGEVLLSCSDVMAAAGVSRSALFNYERHGAVNPMRDENGYRQYTSGDLLDVMCCTMLTSMGYTVGEATELLSRNDIMAPEQIDAYVAHLDLQRDIAQAKADNLTLLRTAAQEACKADQVVCKTVDCPSWLFFRSGTDRTCRPRMLQGDWVKLVRSVPLSCRGFILHRAHDGRLDFEWGRTLRREHLHLLDVDPSQAQVLGGQCVRVVVRALYPNLDPNGTVYRAIRLHAQTEGLTVADDAFVPLLLSNRHPSSVFEMFVPVVQATG